MIFFYPDEVPESSEIEFRVFSGMQYGGTFIIKGTSTSIAWWQDKKTGTPWGFNQAEAYHDIASRIGHTLNCGGTDPFCEELHKRFPQK